MNNGLYYGMGLPETSYGLPIPEWAVDIYTTDTRYIVLHGGRGSGKSWAIAAFLIDVARSSKNVRILCTREIQKSITQSVYHLLRRIAFENKIYNEFSWTTSGITHKKTYSQFIFAGLKYNPDAIQSTEGLDYVWIEEGQSISDDSMMLLIPTIRKDNSKIIVTFNPRFKTDWAYKNFVEEPYDNALIKQVNYKDNPFFPKVLQQELERDKKRSPDRYLHIWEGHTRPQGERSVFQANNLYRFRPELHKVSGNWGLDLSYSGRNALVSIRDTPDGELYIDVSRESSHVGITDMPDWIGEIPGTMVVDSARPEMIDYLRNEGYTVRPSRKGAGSVLNGLDKLARYSKIFLPEGAEGERIYNEFVSLQWDKNDEPVGDRDYVDAVRYAHELIDYSFSVIPWNSFNDTGFRVA